MSDYTEKYPAEFFEDLTLVSLSDKRHPDWPDIYLCREHVLWRNDTRATKYRRNAYVYICDTSTEGMLKALEVGASLEAPLGGDKGILLFGTFNILIISICCSHT
jgi:hypothetical protein